MMPQVVQILLPQLFCTRVLSSLPLIASQVGGNKTQGEEARRGTGDVQTEKGGNGYDIGPLGNKGETGNAGKVNQ